MTEMANVQELEDDNNDIEFISGPASGLSESKSESPVMVSSVRNGSDEEQEVSEILEKVEFLDVEGNPKQVSEILEKVEFLDAEANQKQSPVEESNVEESGQNGQVIEAAIQIEDIPSKTPKPDVEIENIPQAVASSKPIEIEVIHRPDDISADEIEAIQRPQGVPSSEVVRREDERDEDEGNWVDEGAEESDDEDLDETVIERLLGLTEMFPKSLRSGVSTVASGSVSTLKGAYHLSRSASWIFFSSAVILFAPLLFESERAQMEQMQKQQERQILLGPGAAMSGSAPSGGMGMAPPPPR